jgi:Family of unknown function (DUF6247)
MAGNTRGMTVATTRVERSPGAIRAALGPGECAQFEAEFREAAARSGDQLDLAPIDRVLDRWWGVAAIRSNPLSDEERALVARAHAGDDSGWVIPDGDGPRPQA